MPDDTTDDSTEAPASNDAPDSGNHETVNSEEPDQGGDNVTTSIDEKRKSADFVHAPTEDTFPRAYVEELRAENKSWRLKAQQADTYAHRLHTELVKATGRLADPTDMPFNPEHLDDADKLNTAIDDLLHRKPHLASRTPSGDVGQGVTGVNRPSVDLAAILRGNTR